MGQTCDQKNHTEPFRKHMWPNRYAPTLAEGKRIYRPDTCDEKRGWKAEVSPKSQLQWIKWTRQLRNVKVPRSIKNHQENEINQLSTSIPGLELVSGWMAPNLARNLENLCNEQGEKDSRRYNGIKRKIESLSYGDELSSSCHQGSWFGYRKQRVVHRPWADSSQRPVAKPNGTKEEAEVLDKFKPDEPTFFCEDQECRTGEHYLWLRGCSISSTTVE